MEHFDWIKGFVLPYVNFAIFLILAVKFFKKPLASMAQKRRDDFTALLQSAQKAKAEAEKSNRELEERLQQLNAEIDAMKQQAKSEAEREASVLLANAEALTIHIREEAKRIADAEVEIARDVLRNEIMAAVKAGVEQRIRQELNSEKQAQLVRQQVGKIKQLRVEV